VSTTRPPFRPSSSGKRPDPSPGSMKCSPKARQFYG
jgi:hypothetical protein